MKKADIEDGNRPGLTDADRVELREAKKKIRLRPSARPSAVTAQSGESAQAPRRAS